MFFKKANKGEPVSAAEWNKVVGELERQGELIRKMNILLDRVDAGDQGFDILLRCRIASRAGVDADGTGLEPGVKYAVAVKSLNVTVPNVVPTYGRPARARNGVVPRLVAAEVGDICWMVRRRGEDGAPETAEFWIDEQIALKACAPPPGTNSPAAVLERREREALARPALGAAGGSSFAGGAGTGGADGAG